MFNNMTQNASFLMNITTMEVLSKDDNFPKLQQGLELFNDNQLPASLWSSCLAALVTKQDIHRNPPTLLAAYPSPNKKCLVDQVSHMHGLHAISTSQIQSEILLSPTK
jgi:hypothetical protein